MKKIERIKTFGMQSAFRIIKKSLVPALLAVMAMTSCAKDDPDPIPAPDVKFASIPQDTTIKIGASWDIVPTIAENAVNTYEWKLDGNVVASTKAYKFEAKSGGIFTVAFRVFNESGEASFSTKISVKPYVYGTFIINEGQYEVSCGSVNYFSEYPRMEPAINIAKPAEGKAMGKTSQYGTVANNTLYVVSKEGRQLIAFDLTTMTESGAIDAGSSVTGHAFCAINETTGVLTAKEGAYKVTLKPLALGEKLASSDGACGGLTVAGDYLFVLTRTNGILVYKKSDLSLVKALCAAEIGFAETKNGTLWAATTTSLIKINPTNLTTEEIALPNGLTLNSLWDFWNAGSLCASKFDNVVYFAPSGWLGVNKIYRYIPGDNNSLNAPFITGLNDDNVYGSGIRVNPNTGDIYATFVKDGYGNLNDNRFVVYNAKTGAEKSRTNYTGFYFPALVVFNN